MEILCDVFLSRGQDLGLSIYLKRQQGTELYKFQKNNATLTFL